MEKSLLHRFSDSMQIESLWNFNKKYDPEWRPRYAVADDRTHIPRAGLAIARAESVSELPLVGRLMKPKVPAETQAGGAGRVTVRHCTDTRQSARTTARARWRRAVRPGSDPDRRAGEQVVATAGGISARRLGVIGLALVLISAMDSIRNLPTTATFGWSAIFFYGVAVLTYLVPVALCSAELATIGRRRHLPLGTRGVRLTVGFPGRVVRLV